jgi:hypothetical protein
MTDLRYPIGPFEAVAERLTEEQRRLAVRDLEDAPARFRAAVQGLTPEQLDTPYRPGGWTVRQVIHHMPDSHMNMYVRFRMALTEDEPTIKPYDEARWAELADARGGDIEVSLQLLAALHTRLVLLTRALTPEDLARRFRHPERGVLTLDQTLAMYAWHCRHHLAHITGLTARS